MLISLVLPRMNQPDERAAFRVKSAQVRSLVCIAVVAGESEVSAVVSSAMLASDDVLNVIDKERLRILRQATVFAAITGPFADSLPILLQRRAASATRQQPSLSGRAFPCTVALSGTAPGRRTRGLSSA